MNVIVVFVVLLVISTQASVIDWFKIKSNEIFPKLPHNKPPIPKPNCGKIVGGEEAYPHSIPYQAGLIITVGQSTSFCGGSLISARTVLTAAHCVEGASNIVVILGAHNIDIWEETQQRVTTRNYTIHAEWDHDLLQNDIALVHLDNPVRLNEYVQIVSLPSRSETSDFAGKRAKISGWGRASDTATGLHPTLRYVYAPVTTNDFCDYWYKGWITEKHICTDGGGGIGSCAGDSGGPLVYNDKLIGVVSFGVSLGCEVDWPSAFSRVTAYLDWIESKCDVTIEN